MWIIWATQGCKLLHLIGIQSLGALTSCLLLLAYTLPFIRVISKYLRVESEAESPALLSSQGTWQLMFMWFLCGCLLFLS